MSVFVFVVEPDVVHDQIAAESVTLGMLIAAVQVRQEAPLWGSLGSGFGLSLPLVADPDLPPVEEALAPGGMRRGPDVRPGP